ncbi:MAG: diguanylate cyclase [Chloroherpetonaceae bacterium]|nr:diguanylate cyclase [Chloroherpetonaceae bacterium]
MGRFWQRWLEWASPPRVADGSAASLLDQEQQRRGVLLAFLAVMVLPFYVVLYPFSLFPRLIPGFLVALTLCGTMQVIAVLLNRQGRVREAGMLFLSGVLTGCTIGLFGTPPQSLSLSMMVYVLLAVVIVEAGLLLGQVGTLACAVIVCGVVSLHVFQNASVLPHVSPLVSFSAFQLVVTLCIILLFLSGLVCMSEATIARMMQEVYQIGQAHAQLEVHHEKVAEQAEQLAAMNSQLLAVHAELEAQYRALEAANAQLAALATTDGMTGLANHRAFQEELTHQIARVSRSRAPLALMLLDVDHFKHYNDTFGHPAGDEVLKGVAQILSTRVREGDYAARYGGEEFAVILQDTDAETALLVAERVRAAVEAFPFPNRQVTVSIGVALYAAGENADAVIERADVALYEAKSAGRNRVVYLPAVGCSHQGSCAGDARATQKPSLTAASAGYTEPRIESALAVPKPEDTVWHGEGPRGYPHDIIRLLGGLEGLLQEAPAPILLALIDIMDQRSAESWGHSVRVTRYALRLCRAVSALYEELRTVRPLLPRLTPGDLADLAFGALLHDIGKMGIPDAVLRKRGRLTDEEWRQIRRHPLAGAELIASNALLARALPVIRYHHERWDGTGYPQGLRGEAIPLPARIFAVCDTFDTLTVSQVYRDHVSFSEAQAEIQRGAGTQFDPDVVQAFLTVSEEEWCYLASPWTVAPPVASVVPQAA